MKEYSSLLNPVQSLNMKHLHKGILVIVAILAVCLTTSAQDKTGSFKGKLFRSDTKAPLAGARVLLLDAKKSDTKDNSVEATTDVDGKFMFPTIAAGKYTISIRIAYDREEDVPCQLLMGRLKTEKNSKLLVLTEGNKKIYQVFIEGFSVKAGKQIDKDYDLSCVSMFG